MNGPAASIDSRGRRSFLHSLATARYARAKGLLGAWTVTGIALLLAFFPLLYLARYLWSAPPDIVDWIDTWANGTLARQAAETAWVCIVAAVVTIAASVPQAVAVSMYRFRGALLLEGAALAPMLLAPYAAAGAWSELDLGAWSHGPLAMAVQIGFSCAPWAYLALRVAISRLPPMLGEAAAASGMTRVQRIIRVWMPLLAAPLFGAAMFAVARAFGDYGTAARNGAHTFGVSFHDIWNGTQSTHVAAVVALIAAVPAAAVVWFASARATHNVTRRQGGLAGVASWKKVAPPGLMLPAVAGWAIICLALSFAVPEWQYLRWAIDGRWMGWSKAIDVSLDALSTSGAVAVGLAGMGVACALLLRPGARSGLAEHSIWLVSINLFIPPMALALAWLAATADGSWLAGALGEARDGTFPLLLAQAIKLAPFAMLPVLDRVARENELLRDALRTAGLPRGAAAAHVLRMTAPAIALGAAMVFMEAVKELEIAITLQPFGYRSPALKIHDLARFHAEYAIAGWLFISQALMLPALLGVVAWLAHLDKSGRLA